MKNNAPVSLTNSVNNSIFAITNATKRDGGRYICTATNKAGSYEKDFNIIILSPPKLENSYKMPNKYSKKARKEVLKNMPVELICPFSGDPLPQYVWMKDGDILDPNTNSFVVMSNGGKHLKIKHAKAEDAGKYICIAKNEVGEARHDYAVDVLVPPSITSEYASSLSLRERESLTLNCNTTGNPSPFVIWLKDGIEVEANDDDLKFSFSNMNLEITDIKSYHSGKYICIATNLAGSTEKEFNVDVLTPPRLNLEQEEAVGRPTAYVNKPVSLECPISGNPFPQISWMKNGKYIKLEEEQNIYVHDDGRKISILRAKEDDTGLYKCVADNAVGSSAYVFDLEILVPPTIDRRKLQKVYFVKEGGSVTIKCPISGHPKPIITWLKDSDIIPLHSSPHIHFSDGFQNLRLKYASLRDAGRYICIAGNEIGTAEQDFKVDVQVPPRLENLVEKDKNKSSVLNKPVTISCPVSGIPPPVVQWYKNNSILNTATDPNIRLSSDSRHLKIIRTRISDAGIYKCKAANDVGKIEEEFSLDVQIPPKIMETNNVIDYYSEDEDEGKGDLKASENSTVELDCYVDGNPKPAIIWIKDGYLVNDTSHYKVSSNGQLLQVNHITTSDAGHYTCIASNIAGTKEKNFILDVLVPPKIKGPNYESRSLLPNRPAVIECAVDANPPPSVTWLKNGNIINVSQYDLVKIMEDGKMLQFLKTNSNHDGIYTCIAENSIGKAEKNFKVDVFVSPVIQDAHFESEIMENEKVSMDCVSYGNPKPNIIWLRDGQIIAEDLLRNLSIDKLENGFHLKIAEVKMYHTGNYKCIATNIVGSAEKSFDIYVKVFPRITNTSEPNMTVFIHQPVTMYCIAEAEPEASVAWIKDGHIIREDIDPFINILDDGQKLQILRARESDDGQYSCEISNAEGNDSRSFVLNVLVPPRVKNIIQEDSRTHVVEGNSTDIQCYVHGNPLPIVSWMKDGKVLISGKAERLQFLENNQLLHIANVQTEDGGRYTCIASSPLGTEERHFDLFVQVPPKIYDDLNTDYIAHLNKPLIIHCEAEGNPKPVITWMKNGVFLEPFADPNLHFLKEDSALLIRLARIEDSGKYTCVASSSAGQDERNFDIRVYTPVSIDKENLKHDLLTVVNQTIILQCPAFGIPSPAISWLKDGEVLHSSVDSKHQILEGGKVLKVNFAKQSDEGKYSCIAFNDAGTDTAEFIVDVMIPPQMSPLMSQQELKAHEGESIILTCPLIDSNYTHTITWEKNGRKFNTGSTHPHIEFSPDNKKIRIMKSQAQDTGIYTCVVSNSAGTTEYEMNVLVLVPARIDYPADKRTSTYVKEHHSITLECVALGHPQPTLAWFKNGLPLLEHYNATFLSSGKLKIFDASTYDTSVYSCLAQNEAGMDERSYNLTVYIPPLINVSSHGLHKVTLQNTEITLGCPATVPPVIEEASIYGLPDPVVNQSVRIYCDVQGLPFPKISWYKNGALIDQNHKRFSSSGGGRYLDILNIQISDSGTYTCQAENIAGQAKKDIKLFVSVPPDIDEKGKSKEYQVILGKPLRIDCEASGTPPPSITWLKNGLPLSEKDHVQFVNNNYALLFTYTLPDEAGVYTCIATNNAGSVEQKFNLTVLVPPVLNNFKNGDNLSIVAGSSNKLHCSAQGIPMPDIVWSKDNNIISNSEAIHIKDGILEILEADISHNGTYLCEASNVAGKVTKSFDLIVNMPPKIERSDETTFVTSSVKESVDIECVVHGIPPPTVLWFKNKMPILSSFLSAYNISNQGVKLTIRNADLKDSGNYMCVATNSAGNDTKDFVLNILEPPTIKDTAPLIKTQVGNKIALECSVVGVPPPEISWLKENSVLLFDDSEPSIFGKTELYFDNVKLQHAGNYSCIAVNEAGADRKDFVLQVSAPPVIEDNETHQKILAGDSVSLQCLASGYPIPLIMWHKDSILIHNNKDHQILPDGTLHIPKTNLSHTGTYKCLAENEAGSQDAIRRLTVLSPPKIAELSADKYKTTQAHPVILQCSANGEPQPSISWEHNGVSLDLYNPRFKVFPSGDLHISLTQSSDMGTYTCIAKNEAGSATKNIDLIVLVPPVVTINGANTIVAIKGRSVTITCSAVGFPPPHISWQKSGGSVLDSTISDLSRELALHNIQPEDGGNYVCIASNSAGRDHQSVSLDVHVPPVITTLPKSQDISVGDILSLHCEASGHPIPSITWLLNNTQVTGSVHSIFGRSKLHIQNVSKEDEGTYICLAQNAAGERKAAAAVRVRAPPIILDSSGVKSVQVKEAVILDCLVKGDPSPNIIWIKNGQRLELNHRIQVMMNGSLFIYNSSDQDSGHYKCIASNDFGSAERTAELIVKSRPTFIIEPHNTKTEVGNTVHFDCRLDGEPKPTVAWMKDSVLLQKDARVLTFPNNSLQLIAVQQSDEGVYTCFGNNSLGSAAAEAQLIVQVHGKWSNWQEWGQCSASCGDGEQSRQRFCNDPAPKNGGKTCIGLSNEVKKCNERPCPVNGEWGNWLEWQKCSASCGVGQRKRQRKCDNPSPQYGGENCTGLDTETDICILMKCPVDGRWSMWSDWQPCSVSCGKGIQIRIRECKNPEPLHGGQPCLGEGEESQECVLDECAVHGEWGAWNEWSLCSSSCGGGTRERIRLCDSPAPAFGGHYCTGSHIQTDYCNNAQCPINGGWGQWSSWGECSSSCNKGQKKRFRSCDNPTPAGGGRDCLGPSQEIEVCNAFLCPVDGKWSEWSFWSVCSVTCGIGVRSRVRHCDSPDPSYGGKDCLGDNEEFEECGDEACDVAPVQAKGHLIGVINGIDFGLSKLSANITQSGMEFLVSADIQNITEEIAVWMKLLVPLLNPIYWTTAYEIGDAVNGYTLTKGLFRRETQVNFVTGEILFMTHVARGLDKRGNLLVDIVISGEIPDIPTASTVVLHPYFEDYIQTGPGSLYAFSTRTYKVGNYVLPYSWNHTIFYDETQGQMPYVVERLYANGIDCSFDADKQEIKFTVSASITKGYGDECFEGFILSEDGKYCSDIDECEPNNPCSQICSNFLGGFSCLCVNGFALDVDGETCNDVNECDLNTARCSSTEECINIIGSYKCLVMCREGYERSADEQYCLDVDECSRNLHKCSQICINNIGSYSCSCENGYYLLNGVDCIDIDECTLNASCMHICMNIPGSFLCSCYAGYELQSGSNCIDIDECYHGIYNCPEDQECRNIDGGYECIDTCLSGFFRAVIGSCLDIDECHERLAACHFTQVCINTYGSYHCSCLRGYYSAGPGKPCQDINECLQRPRPCSYLCRNIPGDYECVCAPGFKRLSDAKTCVGIEYLDELNLEVQHDFINPERNRSNGLFSESNVPSKDEAISYCETGFYKVKGECKDIDECEDKGKCQHLCENTQGSYSCICPAGYRLGPTGKTCEDIDECLESNIECGASRMCFNMRGSFKCIETPCPPDYDRDPLTGYCKLSCEKAGTACPPNVKYSEILAFKMIALPSGIQAYQDLIRLVAYDQDGVQLPNTVFSIIENDTGLPFRIRLENGKGVLYTQKSMDSNTDYQIKVQAVSYDMENHIIQYTTKFLVFISVSKHPY
ncbi:hemicentin-1-like isoform X3 [Stegodyphus dumicola]|uniref:hemicentin-1-like isoform X3 n=1 Tax=Stegodyphus dumicola TaxID=202533 RepID=UPI0015AD9C74|nr:hemicentin-1-like isoform X3 [Stegodyphus dumicola]